MIGTLPWQNKQWASIQEARKQDRLPHALILAGIPGLGKEHFAQQLAMGIHCFQSENGTPCKQCASCHQIQNLTHPDYRFITVEEKKTQISIEQIRDLQSFMQLSQTGENSKVVIISPAESMNINSANSLLKTLEEPPGSSLLILVTNQPAYLPATVRSRCQIITFTKPEKQEAIAWLEQTGCKDPETWLMMSQGAPCQAQALFKSIDVSQYSMVIDSCLQLITEKMLETVKLESQWKKIPAELLLEWQYSLARDLIRAKNLVMKPHFENQDRFEQLREASNQLDCKRIFKLYETLLFLGRQTNANLKPELYRERMILTWRTQI